MIPTKYVGFFVLEFVFLMGLKPLKVQQLRHLKRHLGVGRGGVVGRSWGIWGHVFMENGWAKMIDKK